MSDLTKGDNYPSLISIDILSFYQGVIPVEKDV
jgi:hypothetical protein